MQAIEFVAQAEDGTIKIPKKYLKQLEGDLRIIILIEKGVQKDEEKKKPKFSALKVKTKKIKLSRDEANER